MGLAPAEVRDLTFWEFAHLSDQWVEDNTVHEPGSSAPSLDAFNQQLIAEGLEPV